MSDAPPVRPVPHAAGHPANHGYVKCANCGSWRRDVGLNLARIGDALPVCFDVYGCRRTKSERLAELQRVAMAEWDARNGR